MLDDLNSRTLLPVVLALLLCHGIFGGLHEVSGVWTVGEAFGHAHAAEHGEHGAPVTHGGASSGVLAGEHCGVMAGYLAVLSSALAGVALALVARVVSGWSGRSVSAASIGGPRVPYGRHVAPPRGRDLLSTLQVFRL